MSESRSFRDSPLWRLGLEIYTFPWQIGNIWIWLLLTGAMIILALIACSLAGLAATLKEVEFSSFAGVFWQGSFRIFLALVVFTIVFSIYPAAYFLSIIEDTANGNDDVYWGDLMWYEALWKWLFLLWVFGCCLAASTVVVICIKVILSLPALLAWAMVLVSALLLFPMPLLSTLIGGSPWILLHPTLFVRLAQKPFAGLSLYAHTVLLMVPCLGLGLWMVFGLHWWLAPITGIVWSTSFLCYARALGQAAFDLGQDDRRRPAKKKRRRMRVREERED
jgi:hypothetical protein